MPLGRLVLGLALALLSVVTVELAALLALAAIDGLTGTRSSLVATVVLDLGSAIAWLLAGGLAYEVVRDRLAVIVVALVPLVGVLVTALARLNGAHLLVRGGVVGTVGFALVLGLATLLGGAAWERHLRPSTPVH